MKISATLDIGLKTSAKKRFLTISVIIFASLIIAKVCFAQTDTIKKSGLNPSPYTIYNEDTIRLYTLPDVFIFGAQDQPTINNLSKYNKLRRDIIRAYPYAMLANNTLKALNDSLNSISSKKGKKKFIKSTEKLMKEKFEAELKKLTISQGKILIKLVDRESGSSSFELIKEYRGSIQALFWQATARLFGSNLKNTYDPGGEDLVMESIVTAIERGEIPVALKQ